MPSDEVKLQMHGIEEMTKNLEKIGTRVALRGPSRAVRAAGSVIIKEMRRRAPKDTGSLQKSLGQKVKTYRRSKTTTSIVGARSKRYETAKGKRNPAYYAHLVELGVKPHKTGKVKARYFRGRGMHPGVEKSPFMRPGFDAAAPEARNAVIDTMKMVFAKEAKALGGDKL
jgi:HK97 gp10 family phage protein